MIALVVLVVWGACEGGWAAVPALRPHRRQLRLHLFVFLVLVTGIYTGSVWSVIPDRFHYGNGVLRYASDSITYQQQAAEVADGLRQGSADVLADSQKFAYSKLLGILFAVVGRNALAGMMLNGVFYSATLACLFLIGREMFGARTGALAMAVAAMWPGFLLHETQTIRWVATTLGLQMTVLGCVMLIGGRTRFAGVLTGLAGYALLLSDLPYMAALFSALVICFGVGLMTLAVAERTLLRPAALMLALGLSMVGAYSVVYSASVERGLDASSKSATSPEAVVAGALSPAKEAAVGTPSSSAASAGQLQVTEPDGFLRRMSAVGASSVSVVMAAREGFDSANSEGQTGTAIPVKPVDTVGELLLNLPAAVGFATFAPLPSTLLADTPGTSNLRRFVIIELLPYVLMLGGALVCIAVTLSDSSTPEARRQTMFLLLLVLLIYALLGTVVVNGGTLYRFRQPYVLLQIVLAAQGWLWLVARVRAKQAESRV